MAKASIDVIGGGRRVLPAEVSWWEDAPRHGVVLLPGQAYTCDMPAFYYLEAMALDLGAAVLRLDARYSRDAAFSGQDDAGQAEWLAADVRAATVALLDRVPLERLTIIGKSLTTIGLAAANLGASLPDTTETKVVWLTPLLREAQVVDAIADSDLPGLVAIGTADHHYDQAAIDRLSGTTGVTTALIEGADHSFDVRGSIERSVGNIATVARAVRRFAFDGAPAQPGT